MPCLRQHISRNPLFRLCFPGCPAPASKCEQACPAPCGAGSLCFASRPRIATMKLFAPCGGGSLCFASRPRIATMLVWPLAGPVACVPRPGPESRPYLPGPLRGRWLVFRVPAPNRDQEAFIPCGGSHMIFASQPRIATMLARPLTGPDTCCARPGPESRPCLPGPLRGRKLVLSVPALNRGQEAFTPCGVSRMISSSWPRIATRKLFAPCGAGSLCFASQPRIAGRGGQKKYINENKKRIKPGKRD